VRFRIEWLVSRGYGLVIAGAVICAIRSLRGEIVVLLVVHRFFFNRLLVNLRLPWTSCALSNIFIVSGNTVCCSGVWIRRKRAPLSLRRGRSLLLQ
jgi:hypothetical protein